MESVFFSDSISFANKTSLALASWGAAMALMESGSDFEGIEGRSGCFFASFRKTLHYSNRFRIFARLSLSRCFVLQKMSANCCCYTATPFQPFLFVTTLFFCSPCLGLVSTLDLVELMMLNSQSREILFANCGQIRRLSAAFAAVRHSSHFMISTIHFFLAQTINAMVTCL